MVFFRSRRIFWAIANPKLTPTFRALTFRSVLKSPTIPYLLPGIKYQIIVGTAQALSYSNWKIHRHFKINLCRTFRGTKSYKIVIIAKDNLNQNKDYWIIDKSALAEFGLILSADNSATEILTALILYWNSGNLNSERIKVIFYRYIKFQEDSKWYEQSSYLVDLLAPFPNFPDPQSFLI